MADINALDRALDDLAHGCIEGIALSENHRHIKTGHQVFEPLRDIDVSVAHWENFNGGERRSHGRGRLDRQDRIG